MCQGPAHTLWLLETDKLARLVAKSAVQHAPVFNLQNPTAAKKQFTKCRAFIVTAEKWFLLALNLSL